MSKASTAPKKTTTSAPPPELDILFDFISDDTRPTFVLQHSTSTVIFRNHAFDTVVSDTPQTSTNWLNDLVNAVRDGAMLDVQKIEDLGTFASRVWSSRKIKKAWTAVFCVRLDYDNGPFEPHPDPLLSEPEHAHVHNEPPDALQPRPDVTPVQNKHSDDMSSYSHSTAASIVTTSQFEKPLEDLTVDWLLFPHPTSDPWFQFLNDHAWEETVLGPIQTWNPTLRQMYTTILASREPRVIYWGNDLCMLYNEPAKFVVGEMHPHPLGKPLGNVWGTAVLVEIIKMVHGGIKRGRPICQRDYELILTRYDDFPESCFFDLVFLPIPSPDGHFMGVLAEFTEITDKVLQRNRQEVSRELIESVSKVTALQDLWTAFVRTLERKSRDVSYALVYTRTNYSSPHDTATLKLEASCNIQSMGPDLPADVAAALEPSTNDVVVLQHRKKTLPPELAVSFPELGTVDTAYVLPIVSLDGRRLVAVVVLGLNPRRALNSSVRQFAESLRDLLFKSVAICSLPLEQREAQEFARTLSHQLETMTVKAEKSEQNFTRMLRDAPIGMCMHRTDGYPIYINDICLELLGMNRVNFFKAAEAGLAWRDAVHDEDLETVNRAWISAIDTGKPVSVEFRIKPSHSVGVRWLELSAQQRHDEEGNLEYLYVWLRNVSSRRQLAEQKLADAIDSKKRSEIFIDMVSHEMRNPLGAILLLADAILTALPPPQSGDQTTILTLDARDSLVDIAANIQLCAKHQRHIIDEILTFSRLDSKLLVLAPERVRPSEIILSVLKMLKAELDHADIQGSMELHQSYIDLAVDNVLLDPGRLSQVVLNLMTNAIKFTKASEKRNVVISLAASRTRPTADDCQVTLVDSRGEMPHGLKRRLSVDGESTGEEIYLILSVKDTGLGLTEAEMSHLFHRFSQASPKTYKQYGGSGLGLFISRELVELQSGQIGVRSESGKGSTFAFYIRTVRVDSLPESTTPPLGQTSIGNDMSIAQTSSEAGELHVLVVEDNAINQKILAQQLRKAGCAKVYVADHGLDALNFLATTNFNNPSDATKTQLSIVLLDVEMPVMDGLTAAKRVRELEKSQDIKMHVPIIGITANARASQIASCIEAGMDEVVTKPFRVVQLMPRMLALVDQFGPKGIESYQV